MKLFIFILLSFGFLNSGLVYATDLSLDSNQEQVQMLEQAQKSVWKVENFSGQGTGFFISKNKLVTNFHAIAPALVQDSYEFILSQKGISRTLKIKKVKHLSPLYDLAVLEIEGEVSDYLNLANKDPHPKENLFLVGYPDGEFKIINKTSDISYEDELEYRFYTDNSYNHGASGAPVLSLSGEVVGVLYSAYKNRLTTTKIIHLKNLLKQEPHSFENPKDHLEHSIKELELMAKSGNAMAQFKLGVLYKNGEGVEQDLKEAVRWFRLAAEQEHAEAQFNLGIFYRNGWGVKKNLEEAALWFEAAAKQGDAMAQFNLGVLHDNGRGMKQDLEEAARWYRESAEQGYADAQFNLGVLYVSGEGVEQNYEEAVRWFRLAAKQGDINAQFNLGISYANGWGVGQDPEEAARWYLLAAEQGDMSAQSNLGGMYKTGWGVEKDPEEAVWWYRKAAEQGHKKSWMMINAWWLLKYL